MNTLGQKILTEIQAQGPLSFARFMELALYCPEFGYYERETDTIGRRGDFYTSVSVGGLFGELLGYQFAGWLETRATTARFVEAARPCLIEAGAHDGRLARDLLGWIARQRPRVFDELDYVIVEPSARRRQRQEQMLREFGSTVRWCPDLRGLGRVSGVLFSNELLDAMPVHRLGWSACDRRWFEWGVAFKGERFVWTRMNVDPGRVRDSWVGDLPDALLEVLPDNYIVEVCPRATEWWREAAQVLTAGWLVTFDYGRTTSELLSPERRAGTLRSYHRHQLVGDVLTAPGEQDITAHVNFSVLQTAGEASGLTTERFQEQGRFLADIAARWWNGTKAEEDWTEQRRREFQTLVHPQHLGQAFRVLVQSRL